MAEFAWFRGLGGGLHCFSLPLSPAFAAQEAGGFLVRVDDVDEEVPGEPVDPQPVDDSDDEQDEDSGESTDVDDEDEAAPNVEKPKQGAPKSVWVEWAVLVSGLSEDEANAMTKAELIDKFG